MTTDQTKPGASPRTHLHTRDIMCRGYQREDGLWDIEATLTDTKTHPFFNHERGEVSPGEAVHRMTVTVTLDLDMVVQGIAVDMPDTPFGLCRNAAKAMEKIIGLQIGGGWMRQVRERVERTESCTHVVELLGPISTTAYQTMHFAIEERENAKSERKEPPILDQCHSLARDSAVVKVMWPQFYTGKE